MKSLTSPGRWSACFSFSRRVPVRRIRGESQRLTTIAERSEFTRTGRYDEVEKLCAAFAARWPDKARCFEFGRSPENRPLLAIAVSDDGVLDPESVRAHQRPVVLFQGGIHAGEIDGKDAGFIALRELLEGRENRGALARATVLFVPVFNVDGHERFGAGTGPTSAVRRQWAGARRRRT